MSAHLFRNMSVAHARQDAQAAYRGGIQEAPEPPLREIRNEPGGQSSPSGLAPSSKAQWRREYRRKIPTLPTHVPDIMPPLDNGYGALAAKPPQKVRSERSL